MLAFLVIVGYAIAPILLQLYMTKRSLATDPHALRSTACQSLD